MKLWSNRVSALTLDEPFAIDERDENGFTPLLWASSYGQLSTVKQLISKGADPTSRGKHGESALLLSSANGHIHVVKELIANGVDVNQTDEVFVINLIA